MKRWFPAIFISLVLFWLIASLLRPANPGEFDLDEFGKIPVLLHGRIKPVDTVARTSLLIIHGRQKLRAESGGLPATTWLAELLMKSEKAHERPVFLIHDRDLKSLFNFRDYSRNLYSFNELRPGLQELQRQFELANEVDPQVRNRFQRAVVNLFRAVNLYSQLQVSLHMGEVGSFLEELEAITMVAQPGFAALRARELGEAFDERILDAYVTFVRRYQRQTQLAHFFPIPAPEGLPDTEWRKMGESLMEAIGTGEVHPSATNLARIVDTYRQADPTAFREAIAAHLKDLQERKPGRVAKSRVEFFFNHAAPFHKAMAIYVMVLLLAVGSWMIWGSPLRQTAFWLAVLGFLLHTGGLLARMYLEGRPPVTNLYSSAVFVGWGSVLLGLYLERIARNGIGSFTIACIGFCTLLVAHHLSFDGDTMEMMRAVLDSNFWLATHVIIITIGYSAMFLAGFLGIVFILRGILTRSLDTPAVRTMEGMIYGVICFATLFSFVGTLLGGIWADQSWGRFWGWDPKENGALLIVLWCAVILHARWGGITKARGMAAMAIFGNIITSWSWFGTNMLGIGLHSYGFMDQAFFWLALFVVSQMAFIGLAYLPRKWWNSPAATPL